MKKTKIYLDAMVMFGFGIILGVISKFLDETSSNSLPSFLETVDLRNFFSRMGIWIFLAVLISLYSRSPQRASVNVFLFFTGMIGSYYLYTIFIAGFFPRDYMMIWIALTILSPLLAFITYYAKGDYPISIAISSVIIAVMCRQTFAFGFWYVDILNILELSLLTATFFVLYQSPKQITQVGIFGFSLYLLTSRMYLF